MERTCAASTMGLAAEMADDISRQPSLAAAPGAAAMIAGSATTATFASFAAAFIAIGVRGQLRRSL
jgi:hypothetical protein